MTFFTKLKILDSESDYSALVSRRILMYLISLSTYLCTDFSIFRVKSLSIRAKTKEHLGNFSRNLFYRYYYIFYFC